MGRSERTRASFVPFLALTGAVVLATLAACGPAEGPKPQSPAPTASPTAPSTATPAPSPSPTAAATSAPTAPSPATAVIPMKPIAASTMEGKLREIGLDPAALQPLNKLDPKTLRDVMNTFTKALGVQCKYCHEKDFKAPTPMKKIATHMWNDFTRHLAMEGGGAVYCDSCHAGRTQLLDRRDLAALGTWMEDNYVDKLKRADKKDHTCDTCHGDPFEGKILTNLRK